MKRMFEVTDQYRLFADFFRWVVKPAIKEINKHTGSGGHRRRKNKAGEESSGFAFSVSW